jgi:hypothetical protein
MDVAPLSKPHAIDREDHDGAEHRHDEADRLSSLIHPKGATALSGPDQRSARTR